MIDTSRLADRALTELFLLTKDESVFRLLYNRHKDVLWRLAMRLAGGDRHEAAEITQEAWVRAVERLSGFRWESSLRTWLCGFVVHCCRERWQRQKRMQNRPEMADAAEEIVPGLQAQIHAFLDLETAFAALPPGYRAVLTLHDMEGYTHEEIGELLQIAPGTSKSQLARARAAMRQFFTAPLSNTPNQTKQ